MPAISDRLQTWRRLRCFLRLCGSRRPTVAASAEAFRALTRYEEAVRWREWMTPAGSVVLRSLMSKDDGGT
jgi:hypothetical protein